MQKPYPNYDQNGRNQLKSIPYLWPKRLKNHTLWGRTYLYSPYKGVPPPPRVHLYQNLSKKRIIKAAYVSKYLLISERKHPPAQNLGKECRRSRNVRKISFSFSKFMKGSPDRKTQANSVLHKFISGLKSGKLASCHNMLMLKGESTL